MHSSAARRIVTAIVLCTATTVAACSTPETPDTPDSQQSTDAAASTPQAATADESTGAATSDRASTSGSSAASTTDAEDAKAVATVAEQFSTLAPKELFDQFDTCTSVDSEVSFDCSGAEVGQFQFFDSEAKAASTTQLLTELRSARIVEDSGQRVVGWTTLGTSAIITVVDNEKGQVMQQLVSSDQEDPRERIFELGLAEAPAGQSTGQETEAETAEPTSPAA